MDKIYQPIVIEKTNEILNTLHESNFFNDFHIKDTTFAAKYLSNILTEKFIQGKLDLNFEEIFEENEFEGMLKEIIVGCTLNELKYSGFIESYEDDQTEEKFFLTQKGIEFMKNAQNKNGLV